MKLANITYKTVAVFYLSIIAPRFATAQAPTLDNPLRSESILCLIDQILGGLTTIAIPIIVLFIIISGFMFVVAGGNEQKIKDAKNMALYTLVGAGVILGADLISSLIINTASGLGAEIGTTNLCG